MRGALPEARPEARPESGLLTGNGMCVRIGLAELRGLEAAEENGLTSCSRVEHGDMAAGRPVFTTSRGGRITGRRGLARPSPTGLTASAKRNESARRPSPAFAFPHLCAVSSAPALGKWSVISAAWPCSC